MHDGITQPRVEARPRKGLCVLDELLDDGSMVLFHVARRELMTLNPTGAFVWELCDGAHTRPSLEAELRAVFPDITSVGEDVKAILEELDNHGMLTVPE